MNPEIERILAKLPDDPVIREIVLHNALQLALENDKLSRYAPHEKQRQLHAASATYTSTAAFGGNRTGKSLGAAAEIAFHLTGRYPDWWEGRRWSRPVQAWVASESWATNIIGCQKMLMGENEAWGTGMIPKATLGPVLMQGGVSGAISTVKVKHESGGWSTLTFRAYEQGRKKFQSASVDVIWLDEEPPWKIYTECSMRVLDARGYCLLAFTPLEGMTETCSHFIHRDEEQDGAEDLGDRWFVSMSWSDNPHLDEKQVRIMEAKYASRPHELEARRNGVPSIGSGACYPVALASIYTPDFAVPRSWPKGAGGDFGWTNPTAFSWWAHDQNSDCVYLYREYKKAETPIKDHSDVMKRTEERDGRIPKFPDPAAFAKGSDGESTMDEYLKNGVHWEEIERRGVEGGISNVLERMLTNRLKVFESCQLWGKEMSMYARDEKGKIIKRNEFHGEHLLDSGRYAIDNILMWRPGADPHWRPAPEPRSGNYDQDYGGS